MDKKPPRALNTTPIHQNLHQRGKGGKKKKNKKKGGREKVV